MLRRGHGPKVLTGLVLAGLLLTPLVATAGPTPNPGKGKVKVKVTHLRHGDTLGPCSGQAPPSGTATLTVFTYVVNDSGGTKAPADFTIAVNGVTVTVGNSFAGSASGVAKTITTFGTYSVTESSVPGYALASASAGCSGTIAAGQQKVCVLRNDDLAAKLTVVKQVVNDRSGTKTPADFTITINGVTAVGGNTFAGSVSGVTRTLSSVGAYSVTEVAVPGYALQSASAGCSGTIALGEQKTCVLTNNDM